VFNQFIACKTPKFYLIVSYVFMPLQPSITAPIAARILIALDEQSPDIAPEVNTVKSHEDNENRLMRSVLVIESDVWPPVRLLQERCRPSVSLTSSTAALDRKN